MADLDALVILTSGSHGSAIEAGTRARAGGLRRRSRWRSRSPRRTRSPPCWRPIPGRRLQVGYMKLSDPAVVHAQTLAVERRLGAARAIEVTVLHPTLGGAAGLRPVCCRRRRTSRPLSATGSAPRPTRSAGRPSATSAAAAYGRLYSEHRPGQHRPRAGPGSGVRRRPGRHRQPGHVAGRRVAAISRADRPTARRRPGLDPLAFPARLPRLSRGGPGRLHAAPRPSCRSPPRTSSTARRSCATRARSTAAAMTTSGRRRRKPSSRSCWRSMPSSSAGAGRRPACARAGPTS